MERTDYFRLHVKMNSRADISGWSQQEIMAAFVLLPPPSKSLDEWCQIMAEISRPPEKTEDEKLADNLAAFQALKKTKPAPEAPKS